MDKLASISLAMTFIAVALLVSCSPPSGATGSTGAPPVTAPLQAAPVSRWDALVVEAKKEGEVIVYTSIKAEARNALNEAFSKKYGIKLEFMVGTGAQLSPRFLSERGAGLYLADVMNAGGTTLLQTMKPKDVFGDIQLELLLPEVLDSKVWVAGKVPFIDKDRTAMGIIATAQRFVMRNTELVKEDEITSYRDLIQPKWGGKRIIMNDPTIPGGGSSFTAILVQDWGPEGARDFLRELVKQDPVITRDANVQLVDLARGKYSLAISPRIETSGQMIATGAPVAFIKVKDAVKIGSMGTGGLSLPTRPPHPNARKVFVNWLLSREGQEIFSQKVELPSARKDVSREGINKAFFTLPDEKVIMEDEEHFNLQGAMLDVTKEIFAPLLK